MTGSSPSNPVPDIRIGGELLQQLDPRGQWRRRMKEPLCWFPAGRIVEVSPDLMFTPVGPVLTVWSPTRAEYRDSDDEWVFGL